MDKNLVNQNTKHASNNTTNDPSRIEIELQHVNKTTSNNGAKTIGVVDDSRRSLSVVVKGTNAKTFVKNISTQHLMNKNSSTKSLSISVKPSVNSNVKINKCLSSNSNVHISKSAVDISERNFEQNS